MSNIKEFDCSQTCKMTKAMRESSFCNKKSSIVDGKIFYGCREASGSEAKEIQYLLNCELWDMELYENCNTCQFYCINNKNPNILKSVEDKKRLEDLVEKLKPNMILYGVTAQQVEQISSTYTKKKADGKPDSLGTEAIKIASFANEALGSILKGRRVDLAFFSLYARRSSALAKNLKNKK